MVEKEKRGPGVPTSAEFTQALGQITWLATQSTTHRDLPISSIEARVLAPLMLKQVRIYLEGTQPLAAVFWAVVSPEVRQKLTDEDFTMSLGDWRSGPEIVVVDCISPYTDGTKFKDMFLAEAKSRQTSSKGRQQ